MSAAPVSLDVIPTIDLIRELQQRYEHTIVVGHRMTSEYTGEFEPVHRIQYKGDYFMLLGLLAEAGAYIRAEHTPTQLSSPDEETP